MTSAPIRAKTASIWPSTHLRESETSLLLLTLTMESQLLLTGFWSSRGLLKEGMASLNTSINCRFLLIGLVLF